jgi:hypothetical protein
LVLFGSVIDSNQAVSAEAKPIRINGAAGRMKLTLDGCRYARGCRRVRRQQVPGHHDGAGHP